MYIKSNYMCAQILVPFFNFMRFQINWAVNQLMSSICIKVVSNV